MIEFIICEDEVTIAKKYKKIIDSAMMEYDFDYQINYFEDYNKKFFDYAKICSGYKVFILDLETKDYKSGIDAARLIREKYKDWFSSIIVITAHEELKYETFSARLGILDFINKLNNCENYLREDIEKLMSKFDNRDESISYEYNHVYYNIMKKDIIYIEKEQDSKRCIIHTEKADYHINETLTNLLDELDKRFVKTHRSMVINVDKIETFSFKENKLTFIDGKYTHLVSRTFRKDFLKNVKRAK